VFRQLLAQGASGLDEQRSADRFVRHAHLGIIGKDQRQTPCNLLRGPPLGETAFDFGP